MSNITREIAEMVDILPQSEQEFAYQLIKRMVLAWDSDYTKVTDTERKAIEEAEQSGFVADEDIDWDNLGV